MIGQKRIDKTGEVFEVLSQPYFVSKDGEKMVDIITPSDGLTICSLAWMMSESKKV